MQCRKCPTLRILMFMHIMQNAGLAGETWDLLVIWSSFVSFCHQIERESSFFLNKFQSPREAEGAKTKKKLVDKGQVTEDIERQHQAQSSQNGGTSTYRNEKSMNHLTLSLSPL